MVSKVKAALTGSGLSEAFLNSLGTEILENFAQEAVMEPLSEGAATLIGGKDTANWNNIVERSINAGIDGILSALLLKGVSLGIGSANNVMNKINSNEVVTQSDITNMINDLKKSDRTGYEQTVQGTVDAIIEKIQNSTLNLQRGQLNNNNNIQNQQVTPLQNKVAENGLSEQIKDRLKNEKLYFRFDDEGGFRGKEHQSGISMWEDRIDNLLQPNYEAYEDIEGNVNFEAAQKEVNDILRMYDTTYEEYDNMSEEDKIKIKREIAMDKGLITNGASVFELTEDGLDFFESYNSNHNETDYPQVNIFTGKQNGWGADGESVVIPSEVFYTGKTKEISDILYDYELNNRQKIDKILDLIDKTMYNNIESESGINEQFNRTTQTGDMARNISQSRLVEEQKKFEQQRYQEWEQSIKPKQESNFTYEERQVKQKIEKLTGKKIIFIEEDNGNGYTAGASFNNSDTLYINTEKSKQFGLEWTALHETMESNIRFAKKENQDIIISTIDDIIRDETFKIQKEEFWKNQEGKIPSDTAIAKELICDRYAELNGAKLDYKNVLSKELKDRIDMSIEYFNQELEKTSSFNLPIREKTMKDIGLPPLQNNTIGERVNWNEIERPEGKFRKHYRSIIESSNTTLEAKKIAKEVMRQDTYIPDSNIKQLQKADERISLSGADAELKSMISKTINNEKITAVDVAVGERLIEYYSKIGDAQKLQDAIQTTAMVGTQLGQAVQAMSILNHQTPQGQVVWIQRSIDKMNNELRQKRGEKAQQFHLTDNMIERILHSENEQQMNKNLDIVYKQLGQQVHKSTIEQLDSWRYFAMLGNFRTHIRNMTGNFFMGMAQDTKNKVAGAIEGTVAKFVPNMERTQTVKIPSKEVVEFAKNDIQNVLPQLEGKNKYNPKNALEINMRTFKSDALENTLGRMFNWNDNLLEAEDTLGLKSGYKKALAQYITANDIDINNITDKQLAKARNYAIKQAQERTFHQANSIASAINSFTRKNKVTKAIGDAILPFVKTPANVAKTGIEYSPVGLSKAIVYDTVQLRKGNININQYIDNLSKGLTGSAITVLGYALAQAGILKAGGSDDDKKEKFDQQSGKQAYSIQVGDKTYSIDWLAPVGIPLMVGAEIYEGLTQKSDEKTLKSTDDEEALNKFLDKAEVLTNSLTSTLDPMVEMSMISGLVSSIKSFAQGDTQALSNMMTNMGKSYINQYVPTLLGQFAKTTDTVERDTTSTKSGTLSKVIDSTINQVKSKVPILRQTLPVRTDIWGEEQKLNDNWAMRFFEAGILPMNIKNVKNNKVVNELNELYDRTGESSILPTTINKKVTIDGQDHRLTNQEYNKYKTMYGRNSYKLINELVNSDNYKKMTDIQKQTAIEEIYIYVKEQNKIDYCKNNNLEYKESTLSKIVNKLNNEASNYFEYKTLTKDMKKDKEKINVLVNASYSDKTKEIIYKEDLNSEDKKIQLVDKLDLPINQYLKYKQQEFENDKDMDGETISGTKKQKVYDYLNSISNEELPIIYKKMICKLENINDYNSDVARYVINKNITQKDKKELLKILGFKVDKNGNVQNTTILPITKNIK